MQLGSRGDMKPSKGIKGQWPPSGRTRLLRTSEIFGKLMTTCYVFNFMLSGYY